MPFSDAEKLYVEDLLLNEEQNRAIIMKIAANVTKNMCRLNNAKDALEYIFVHVEDLQTLLHKRSITKEILFNYLHSKQIPVENDFTKLLLIKKICNYWETTMTSTSTETASPETPSSSSNQNMPQISEMSGNQTDMPQRSVHLLARQFSEWFFDNLNNDKVSTVDFWIDARLLLCITVNSIAEDQKECLGAECVVEELLNSKQQHQLNFNPNLTSSGVQGRMDVHGLVLVLVCGTLHTREMCVGVFECTIGILRDPYMENNWKIKAIECTLRSQSTTNTPSLEESATLQNALKLSIPDDELFD